MSQSEYEKARMDIAKAAMQGLLASGAYKDSTNNYWTSDLADQAVGIADALLARLK